LISFNRKELIEELLMDLESIVEHAINELIEEYLSEPDEFF
jgi:hypothetical protein